MAQKVTIEVQFPSPTAAVVALRGEHDLDSRPGVMLALAAASDHENVLVDLSECTFIDSSVISALLLASRRLQDRGGALELVIPPGAQALRRVLEMTKVQTLLPWHETRAAGMQSVLRPPRTNGRPHDGARAQHDLRAVSELIDQLQAKAESIRARRAANHVTVVRAFVAPDAAPLARSAGTGSELEHPPE